MQFDERTLPNAVRWLFQVNGYSVDGPLMINGAEVDLVADQLAGYSSQRVYIEVTTQYVDNVKYGKDLTKLAMFQHERGAFGLIVSTKGFSPNVMERAKAVGIDTLTYDELFKRFEKTSPYVTSVLHEGPTAEALDLLEAVYVEPEFRDSQGRDRATEFLAAWNTQSNPDNRWVVVVGEYGTGKTALTRILQRRWTRDYWNGSQSPLPFRIELRGFNKQFDARGLLHHFLDRNALGALGIDFVESMVAQGRVTLLLDGYDEMAQYLSLRERRACLEALADLAQGGARGVLTSRPNYFTEAEELHVFEALYRNIAARGALPSIDRQLLQEEDRLDALLDSFVVNRAERTLRDLDLNQARALVQNHLKSDPAGRDAVLGVLRQVTRNLDSGQSLSLSGKPVIVSYLLDVVEDLKGRQQANESPDRLTEYQIFGLILDNLMLRDYRRSPELLPLERRSFLRQLSMYLTKSRKKVVEEDEFIALVRSIFSKHVSKKVAEGFSEALDILFTDLRSSSTLTRAETGSRRGWQFSHSSLMEFLLVEELVSLHVKGVPLSGDVPFTEAMQMFVRSLPQERAEASIDRLAQQWIEGLNSRGDASRALSFLWPALRSQYGVDGVDAALRRITGPALDLTRARLNRLDLSERSGASQLHKLAASNCEFSEVNLAGAILTGASFDSAILEAVSFQAANLANSTFRGALLWECDLTGATVAGADFRELDPDSSVVVESRVLSGQEMVGFLNHLGALTDEVAPYYRYAGFPDFQVCIKVARYLMDEGWRQKLGIETKGTARKNPKLARDFVAHLTAAGLVDARGGGRSAELIQATSEGRAVLLKLVEERELDSRIETFLARNLR